MGFAAILVAFTLVVNAAEATLRYFGWMMFNFSDPR